MVETDGAGPRGRRGPLGSRMERSCTSVENDMMQSGRAAVQASEASSSIVRGVDVLGRRDSIGGDNNNSFFIR